MQTTMTKTDGHLFATPLDALPSKMVGGEHTGQDDVENGGLEEQRTRGHADDLRAADAADE